MLAEAMVRRALSLGGVVSDVSLETVPLGHGFALDCSFPSLTAVDIVVRFRRLRLWHHRFDDDHRGPHHSLNLFLVKVDLGFEADMFQSEVIALFALEVRSRRRGGWRKVVDTGNRVLLHFDPGLGEVVGTAAHPPQVDDATYGRSQASGVTVLRIHVDDDPRELCAVGSIVKRVMFPSHPPFVFNTVACVGAFPRGGPGPYTDPTSIWFNTFLGYYQLDCAKSSWSRPFGYKSADGAASEPEPEDLARLGKADWNWFSNWNYGVPTDVAMQYSTVDMGTINFVNHGLVTVGSSRWHEIELNGAEVASSYVSDAPGAGQLVSNTVLHDVWRQSFGGLNPRPGYTTSFVPTVVNARVNMAYWEDDDSYHTVLFGGTARAESDPGFLAVQLKATKAVIDDYYPAVGFSP